MWHTRHATGRPHRGGRAGPRPGKPPWASSPAPHTGHALAHPTYRYLSHFLLQQSATTGFKRCLSTGSLQHTATPKQSYVDGPCRLCEGVLWPLGGRSRHSWGPACTAGCCQACRAAGHACAQLEPLCGRCCGGLAADAWQDCRGSAGAKHYSSGLTCPLVQSLISAMSLKIYVCPFWSSTASCQSRSHHVLMPASRLTLQCQKVAMLVKGVRKKDPCGMLTYGHAICRNAPCCPRAPRRAPARSA